MAYYNIVQNIYFTISLVWFTCHHSNPTVVQRCSDHAIGRVHFPVDQLTQHDSEIVVQSDEQNGKMDVHLGFLQFHYNYQVKFVIKDKLGEDVTSDPLQNLNVRMLEAMPSEDG